MAVIESQLEFNSSYSTDAKASNYGQTYPLGMNRQCDVSASGLREIISQFNNCMTRSVCWVPFEGIDYQDYLSTHARFFGVNFRQDADKIYIKKSDLPGLISNLNNTSQSLFAALLLRVLLYESTMTSVVNIYKWNTFFVDVNRISRRLTVLVIEINVLAKYKYVDVEIINANTTLSPNEL